jgi:hypothetical protein
MRCLGFEDLVAIVTTAVRPAGDCPRLVAKSAVIQLGGLGKGIGWGAASAQETAKTKTQNMIPLRIVNLLALVVAGEIERIM